MRLAEIARGTIELVRPVCGERLARIDEPLAGRAVGLELLEHADRVPRRLEGLHPPLARRASGAEWPAAQTTPSTPPSRGPSARPAA